MNRHRFISRIALLLGLTTSASAQTSQHIVQSTFGAFPSFITLPMPKFDPAVGSLKSMTLQGHVIIQGSLGVESLSASATVPNQVFFHVPANVSGSGVNFSTSGNNPLLLPVFQPFDGVVDYAGTSGGSFPFSGPASEQTYFDFPAWKRDLWTGTGSVPVTMTIQNFAVSSTQFNPSYSVNPNYVAQARLTVRYTYTNAPDEFCHEQCPCTGGSFIGGCPNSESLTNQGARLSPSSSSSISNDTFTLSATGLPATTAVAFFQGTTHTATGTVFGDGNLCIGGALTRLGIKFAVGGAAQYPDVGDPSISVAGMIPAAGVQRAYQAYYRDSSAGFCTSATFNLGPSGSCVGS